jgi:hypothetical protein
MLFAFAMPVQATDVLGFAPVESLIDPVTSDEPRPAIKAPDSVRHQLEAADLYLTSIEKFKVTDNLIGGGSSNAQWPDGSGAMHEVGWRNYHS